MTELVIQASNIKCGGCADAIRKGLAELDPGWTVDVEVESGTVTVRGENADAEAVRRKLAELGYPPAG